MVDREEASPGSVDTVAWLREKGHPQWQRPLPREIYAARHAAGENFGLFIEGCLAAIVSLLHQAPSHWHADLPDGPIRWLSTLATANAFRGRDLGKTALAEVMRHLRGEGVDQVWLDCSPGFLQAYYEAAGFRVAARGMRYVSRAGCAFDLVLMSRVPT